MTRTALYAGSFDPVTNGHLAVVQAACRLFDRLVIAVGVHHAKAPLFSAAERLDLLQQVCGPVAAEAGCALELLTFDGLVTAAAQQAGASVLVRGLRDGTDFDYEMQMAGMNAVLAPGLQTIFIPATAATRALTASLVRQIATMGGDVRGFVPSVVAERLASRQAGATQE
jgi:pantetheine-phosphate adenylyltransferase